MPTFTQDGRPILITTPLGKDVLLLEGFTGKEALSDLFHYQLDLLAEATQKIAFDQILGKEATITVELPQQKKRYLSGIVSQFTHCGRVFTGNQDKVLHRYRAEIVPKFWLLTKKSQSRIFQQLSVPDILKKVLTGLTVTWQIQGTFEPRDYCVQYRESDFAFASRLMEEEGIWYFFKHAAGSHEMIVSNAAANHTDIPGDPKILFEENQENRIHVWEKTQEIHTGKFTVWDHCFEMPDKNLQAEQPTLDTASAGTVSHKLKLTENSTLEVYDYPGRYANRVDGITPAGGEQAAKLQKIFDDNKRTVAIRQEEETAQALLIHGESTCLNFTTGHKFTIEKHFDANGNYVLTRLEQSASIRGAYLGGGDEGLVYDNKFSCIPFAVPFRPAQKTPKPFVHGNQTAVVVGPAGQEIFTDKYSRVKVQFFWDREGKLDANSSCWVRVGSIWAGNLWGAIHIPRIGQEVIVAFLEGDPDQPIVVGSVYNAAQMPPYTLPDNMTQSGIKSRSTLKGTGENFNELRFEDKKGEEEIYFHAEKNFTRIVENDDVLKVGFDKKDKGNQTIDIYNDRTETIEVGHETLTIKKGNRTETIKEGNDVLTIEKGNRTETIKKGDETKTIETGSQTYSIKKDDTLTVEGKQTFTITGDRTLEVKTGNISTKAAAGTITIDGATSVEIKCGGSTIKLEPAAITIKSAQIKIDGDVLISGPKCTISSGTILIG